MTERSPLVLVINRNPDELGDLFALLDAQDYRVATRLRSIDALKYVCEHRPHLVLVSARGAGEGEANLARKIAVISPSTRVVILGEPAPWCAVSRKLPGGALLLSRPGENDELLRTVRRVLAEDRCEVSPLDVAPAL